VVACPRRRVEERLTNINEAMLLDSSKPGLEQDINSKSLVERQIDFAANIQQTHLCPTFVPLWYVGSLYKALVVPL
jgi:hypothetical protein